jgi:hypothetical protein
MTSGIRYFLLFLVLSLVGTQSMYGSSSQQASQNVAGTWSGTFQSRQPHFSPFTITVVINPDPSGHLVGTASVSSDCLRDGVLHVTINGSSIVLAGGDDEGDHVTFEGTIDQTGTLLNLKYVLNSSASARCESDDGTGNMVKR